MDQDNINALGAQPLQETLGAIAGVPSKDQLLINMAELNQLSVQMPVGVYVDNDAMQSDQYISYLSQWGLGLPDRDWYLSEGDESHEVARQAYRDYIETVMELAGYDRPVDAGESVLTIEFLIAQSHWDRVKNRQRELTYNKMALDDLNGLAPDMNWADFLEALGITENHLCGTSAQLYRRTECHLE